MKRQDKVFEFYEILCKVKGKEVDRKEFARWRRPLAQVVSWLVEAGFSGEAAGIWLRSASRTWNSGWWVPVLRLSARGLALRKREREWERQKAQETNKHSKPTGLQRADFSLLAATTSLSKTGFTSTAPKPPTALGAGSASSRAENGEP